jgi:hypothetical protein
MALDLGKLVREKVGLIDDLTASLQVTVVHEAAARDADGNVIRNVHGEVEYDDAVDRKAIVEYQNRVLVSPLTGKEQLLIAKVTLPRDVEITPDDRLTLPNGETAPIIRLEGVVDPETSRPYSTAAYLGR